MTTDRRPHATGGVVAAVLALAVVSACSGSAPSTEAGSSRPPKHTTSEAAEPSPTDETPAPKRETNPFVTERPPWLGKRVLARGPGGFGVVQPTPPILRNRRFATSDILPPPENDRFKVTIKPVPPSVLERSTWRPKCPVGVDELSYLTMTFWGFDRETHTGEMIVNASVARQIVGVFKALHKTRFPIEEMRVVTLQEQRAWQKRPTGDTNVTSSFECRPATLGSSWSEHSYGLAIDINPFHNPYLRGELVGPELASAYTDRTWRRPGMVLESDAVTRAFDAIGWGWGGRWSSLKDWMHFSQSGH